jgi:hypothetical protein
MVEIAESMSSPGCSATVLVDVDGYPFDSTIAP